MVVSMRNVTVRPEAQSPARGLSRSGLLPSIQAPDRKEEARDKIEEAGRAKDSADDEGDA